MGDRLSIEGVDPDEVYDIGRDLVYTAIYKLVYAMQIPMGDDTMVSIRGEEASALLSIIHPVLVSDSLGCRNPLSFNDRPVLVPISHAVKLKLKRTGKLDDYSSCDFDPSNWVHGDRGHTEGGNRTGGSNYLSENGEAGV